MTSITLAQQLSHDLVPKACVQDSFALGSCALEESHELGRTMLPRQAWQAQVGGTGTATEHDSGPGKAQHSTA